MDGQLAPLIDHLHHFDEYEVIDAFVVASVGRLQNGVDDIQPSEFPPPHSLYVKKYDIMRE
jgi:hypothetical protein